MSLRVIATLGQKAYVLEDVEDEAPLVRVEFVNDFGELPADVKCAIATKMLKLAVEEMIDYRERQALNWKDTGF